MAATIVSIGNGGFNIARDIRDAGVLTNVKFIVCDTDAEDLARNGKSADMTFLLEGSIEPKRFFTENRYLVEPIAEELTDEEVYIIAALGGRTTWFYVPHIAFLLNASGKFVWHILSTPAVYEGKEVMDRSNDVLFNLMLFDFNMRLIQDNNKLANIPDLSMDEMNRPIVDTMSIVSLFNIRKSYSYTEDYTEYIPERYRDVIRLSPNPWLFPSKK